MMADRECKLCAHSFEDYDLDAVTGEHLLQCRRYPPQACADDGTGCCVWTVVKPSEWCGEFQLSGVDIIERLENEYMELPRDCSDRVIHVGDTVLDEDELLEIAGIVDSDYVIVLTEYGYARTLYRKRLALVPPDDGDGAAAID